MGNSKEKLDSERDPQVYLKRVADSIEKLRLSKGWNDLTVYGGFGTLRTSGLVSYDVLTGEVIGRLHDGRDIAEAVDNGLAVAELEHTTLFKSLEPEERRVNLFQVIKSYSHNTPPVGYKWLQRGVELYNLQSRQSLGKE